MNHFVMSILKNKFDYSKLTDSFSFIKKIYYYLDYPISVLFVAILYAITGYIGLKFAIPPGYATPIWIPSGIALGIAMIYGIRILPAIFLGSWATNFLITMRFNMDLQTSIPYDIALIIGIGATLQTLFAWYLIKKTVGLNNQLIKPNDILLFALLSGPLGSLINSTWSNTGLLLLGLMPLNHYFINWQTWWIGDCIGVLIFTPSVLILFGNPKKMWRQRIVPILFPLSIVFIGVTILYSIILKNNQATLTVISSSDHFSWQLWLMLVSILLFCVLVNIVLFIINGQKMLVQQEAHLHIKALKDEEYKNLLILQSAGEGIYGIDTEGKLTFMNPAAERMLGYQEKDFIGRSTHEILHHSHADGSIYPKENCPIDNTYRYGKISHVTNETFWRKNGSYFWVEYTSSPIKDGNKIKGAVVVFNDITQRREFEAELQHMAYYDLLTELPNRAGFLKHLYAAVVKAKVNKTRLAVCFIDIDNFKQINDNLGHTIGDRVLSITAKLIKSLMRSSDSFSRLGGDEFAIVIENVIHPEIDICPLLDSIFYLLNQSIYVNGDEVNISISIGVALFPDAGEETEELIKNADIAMYHAKELGKGTYAFFDNIIYKMIHRRHQMDRYMRQALLRQQFSMKYQLLIDARSRQPVGLEALVRWESEEFGEISPEEFIPIAEKNGMIQQIGEWVLRKSCSDYQKVFSAYDHPLLLSVNISVTQLENANFIEVLKNIVADTKISTSNLLLELTETALMRNPDNALKIMVQLKNFGVHFALDDFGVSYSSMKYLKKLPISVLKIDQEFVRDIITNHPDAEIVNATIQLAHSMGLRIIAEGVETQQQFEMLKKMGCEYVQGFYFTKPLSLEELVHHPMIKARV